MALITKYVNYSLFRTNLKLVALNWLLSYTNFNKASLRVSYSEYSLIPLILVRSVRFRYR